MPVVVCREISRHRRKLPGPLATSPSVEKRSRCVQKTDSSLTWGARQGRLGGGSGMGEGGWENRAQIKMVLKNIYLQSKLLKCYKTL